MSWCLSGRHATQFDKNDWWSLCNPSSFSFSSILELNYRQNLAADSPFFSYADLIVHFATAVIYELQLQRILLPFAKAGSYKTTLKQIGNWQDSFRLIFLARVGLDSNNGLIITELHLYQDKVNATFAYSYEYDRPVIPDTSRWTVDACKRALWHFSCKVKELENWCYKLWNTTLTNFMLIDWQRKSNCHWSVNRISNHVRQFKRLNFAKLSFLVLFLYRRNEKWQVM